MTDTVERRTITRTDDDVNGNTNFQPVGFVSSLVYVLFIALELLLFIRFALSLAGANRANQFADTVYRLSAPFVAPFRGLFNSHSLIGGNSVFEYEVLVAMFVYALFAMVILMLIRSFRTLDAE